MYSSLSDINVFNLILKQKIVNISGRKITTEINVAEWWSEYLQKPHLNAQYKFYNVYILIDSLSILTENFGHNYCSYRGSLTDHMHLQLLILGITSGIYAYVIHITAADEYVL